MDIPQKQISSTKKIGKTGDDKDVMLLQLIGGLYLVVCQKDGGGFRTLGAGSHPAIAKHIALQDKDARVKFDTLDKSEYPFYLFADLLPDYLQLTKSMQDAQG